MKRENLVGVRPRLRRRHARCHIGEEEAAEDEGIGEQEDPHHGLPPRCALEGALVRRPVLDNAAQATLTCCLCAEAVERGFPHLFLLPHVRSCRQSVTRSPAQPSRSTNTPSHTSSRKCQYMAQRSMPRVSRFGSAPGSHARMVVLPSATSPPRM